MVTENDYYEWTCPKCGLEIRSFHKAQFDWNKDAHIAKHKKNPNGDKHKS